jgi:hypothetical protein
MQVLIRSILGLILVGIGTVMLGWGIFRTDRDKVSDTRPIQVATQERKDSSVPSVLGALSLAGGVVLLLVPERVRL